MRLGIVGHTDSGKSVTCHALAALLGEAAIALDTPAGETEGWLCANEGLDGVILVVNIMDGPMPFTRAHLALAAQAQVQPIAVWLNKLDIYAGGPELLEIIEMETRDLMAEYQLEDEDVPVVAGSSLKALQEIESEQRGEWVARLSEMWEKGMAYAQRSM